MAQDAKLPSRSASRWQNARRSWPGSVYRTSQRGWPIAAGLFYSWPMESSSLTWLPWSASPGALSTNGYGGFWRMAYWGWPINPALVARAGHGRQLWPGKYAPVLPADHGPLSLCVACWPPPHTMSVAVRIALPACSGLPRRQHTSSTASAGAPITMPPRKPQEVSRETRRQWAQLSAVHHQLLLAH
jgi:hypothetical protein